MDADVVNKFRAILSQLDMVEDLITLAVMFEMAKAHQLMLLGLRLATWREQGWTPNPAGVQCVLCGGATWGKQSGLIHYIKCLNFDCGITNQVQL